MKKDTILLHNGDEASPVNSLSLQRLLDSVEGILLECPPKNADFSSRLSELLDCALDTIPFYLIFAEENRLASEVFMQERGSVFDRIVSAKEEIETAQKGCVAPLLIVNKSEVNSIIKIILEDLEGDQQQYTTKLTEKYLPKVYWDQRARHFGNDGRSVCFASSSRRVNKHCHFIQQQKIKRAVKNAAKEVTRIGIKPNLLDYGCGIGRLYPAVKEYVNYVGVDISFSMIDIARQRFDEGRFFQIDSLAENFSEDFDIFMFVAVLHHSNPAQRKQIYDFCASYSAERSRAIFIEDFTNPHSGKSCNFYPCVLGELLDGFSSSMKRICTIKDMEVFGMPPLDYLQRTALIDIELF